jgi:serine/threonine protein kinase
MALIIPPPHLSMKDFEIIASLGRGKFGKVMLCKNKETGEHFAIKTVRKKLLIDENKTLSVIAERNVLMLVRCPFIVGLRFAFQTSSKFYLGLEYAPGGELFHRMETGLLPLADVRLYAAEITLAIEHLHRFGIVYRDLKPENILFDAQGHIKLTDFGLAKDLSSSPDEATKTFCGTSHYIAPELVLNKPYSYEVDWWALGVLLCELLCGGLPFIGDSLPRLFEQITKDIPMIPIGVDPEGCDLILKLLEKDPARRLSYAGVIAHPFFATIDWEAVLWRSYTPSWVPEVSDKREGLKNFSEEFTKEAPVDSVVSSIVDTRFQNVDGFSFNAPFGNIDENGDLIAIDFSLFEEAQALAREVDLK